jgi:hypothetical protein
VRFPTLSGGLLPEDGGANTGIEFTEPQGSTSPGRDNIQLYGEVRRYPGMSERTDLAQMLSALIRIGGRELLRAPNGTTSGQITDLRFAVRPQQSRSR